MTALYELVPAGTKVPGPASDANPFIQTPEKEPVAANNPHLFRLRLRYKNPGETASILQERDIPDATRGLDEMSRDFRWATSVAGFGMLLRGSPHVENLNWEQVQAWAQQSRGEDARGFRREFLTLVSQAKRIVQVEEQRRLARADQ